MTDHTPLDRAHAEMQAAPQDGAARLSFFDRLAAAELFLWLEASPEGDQVSPNLFEAGDDRYVRVFDREHRLAHAAGGPAPYVALSGRAIAGMLAGQGIGMALNLDVAASSILLPATAIDWLHDTLGNAPREVEARITAVHAPGGLPDSLVTALDARLASATGLAQCAWLVAAERADGSRGHLLAFVGAAPAAHEALARAASAALTFSGIDAGEMDVGFFDAAHPVIGRLARVGLRFDLPQPVGLQQSTASAPGSDPAKPPILK
ncbi:SseB family protein [Sulfitobacter sp. D35]|uniref:SseB family protein n=1 Tax=Sulfitobacter sp. D35 TaxID=3083252 RepID=UPI00296F8C84|nr:SseB family protein [Sulfitobacter sp. D35]MDW4499112.1 SseB family protein [Sulfitobacter sp. D35]